MTISGETKIKNMPAMNFLYFMIKNISLSEYKLLKPFKHL